MAMTTEQKLDFAAALLKGACLDRTQINIILESGTKISYNDHLTNECDKPQTNQHLKQMIMEYVGRLKPMVRKQYQQTYDQMWTDILDLKEVKLQVYNRGKQQDTSFNRNLVAQIMHMMGNVVYTSDNTVLMANYLEPSKGKDHPVRQKLGEVPEKPIKKVVDEYIKQHITE